MYRRTLAAVLLLMLAALAGCIEEPEAGRPAATADLPMALQKQFANVPLRDLAGIAFAPGNPDLAFAVLRPGQIVVFPNRPDTSTSSVFLDLTGRVDSFHNEQGLLGLAFDPDYESNGFFYVSYTAPTPERSVISRFSVREDDPLKADRDSEMVILEVRQYLPNHNGGNIAFGPDGFLYIGLGDGGGAGDPLDSGQDTSTLLGAILRIDVSDARPERPYAIPEGNPFAGKGEDFREEIWAYGFRNPWRFSFDRETGDLWVADVGQSNREEVNIVEAGENYGWNIMEGSLCYPPGSECDKEGLVPPVFEYSHSEGCAIIGGYVYRGQRLPSLEESYIFGDYCRGRVWALDEAGDDMRSTLLIESALSITAFAETPDGEIYVLSQMDGIYRLVPRNQAEGSSK